MENSIYVLFSFFFINQKMQFMPVYSTKATTCELFGMWNPCLLYEIYELSVLFTRYRLHKSYLVNKDSACTKIRML